MSQEHPQETIRSYLQLRHNHAVWSALMKQLCGWRDGLFTDHINKTMADAFDVALEPPTFLDELIELATSLEPPKDVPGSTE